MFFFRSNHMGCLWSKNAAEFSTVSPSPSCLAGDDPIPYHSWPRAVLTEPLATLLLQGGSFSEDKTPLLNFTFTPILTDHRARNEIPLRSLAGSVDQLPPYRLPLSFLSPILWPHWPTFCSHICQGHSCFRAFALAVPWPRTSYIYIDLNGQFLTETFPDSPAHSVPLPYFNSLH